MNSLFTLLEFSSFFFTNYAIFLKLCDQMWFEVNCVKLHHRVMSDGLHCDQLTPRQRTTPMAANPQNPAYHPIQCTLPSHLSSHHTVFAVENKGRIRYWLGGAEMTKKNTRTPQKKAVMLEHTEMCFKVMPESVCDRACIKLCCFWPPSAHQLLFVVNSG